MVSEAGSTDGDKNVVEMELRMIGSTAKAEEAPLMLPGVPVKLDHFAVCDPCCLCALCVRV